MSRLLVVTRPTLVSGFHLAGTEAYAAASSEAAQSLIGAWLEAGESGLLVVDEELYLGLTPAFRKRLAAAARLPCVAVPSGEQAGQESAVGRETANLIRRTVGFHITFRGEQS